MICLENVFEDNILTFCNDKHSFCKNCLNNYLKSLDKNTTVINCPHCRNVIFGKEEVTMINNKKEGLYRLFHANDNIKIECNYVNDKKEGLYQEWNISGQKIMECNYINDKKEGLYKEWSNRIGHGGWERIECNYMNDIQKKPFKIFKLGRVYH